jgi:putative heme-binding domain-containing protein
MNARRNILLFAGMTLMAFSFSSADPRFIRLACAAQLPYGFEQSIHVDGLWDPNAIEFSPDGRLFIGERITGRVRVVKDGRLLPEPFVTLPVPPEIPGRRERAAEPGFKYDHIYFYGNYRSSGLEGMAFDPDFQENGHVYLYFMNDQPRLNRVVRVTAGMDPNVAEPGSLKVLLDIPMHTEPTDGPVRDGGSHNGGALFFGPDGKLYVTVGDGWNPAPRDGPQDLSLLIGKVLRIEKDGSVPDDNPFVDLPGARPEIWALGFRNPATATVHPESGQIYVNDVVGGKQTVFQLSKGGNYQHPFHGGVGPRQYPLHSGVGLIAGGAWYFGGTFPEQYHGSLFITDWRGHAIRRMISEEETTVVDFASGTFQAGQIKTGSDGSLYWLSTTYETLNGTVYRIHFRPETPLAIPPVILPDGGEFENDLEVQIHSSALGAEIRYTLNGEFPSASSPLYTGPFMLRSSATVKARAFAADMHPSASVLARFESTAPFELSSGRDLAARWPLDDGKGTIVRDISSQGRHGQLRNGSWKKSDGLNWLEFNGRDSYTDLGEWDLEHPTFAISAWVRPSAFLGAADHRIISKATGEAEHEHYWMLSTFRQEGIRLRFRLKTGGHTSTLIAGSGDLPLGKWSHVAATFDGAVMRLFLNGEETGAMPKIGLPDRNPEVPVWLGANPKTRPSRSFVGAIREVQLHNRPLSEIELSELIRKTEPRPQPREFQERDEQMVDYAPALNLSGNIEGGREIFLERCISCHGPKSLGQSLGPDLESLAGRQPEELLEAILDPNRDIAPEHWLYRLESESNGALEGMIIHEDQKTLTIRTLVGEPQTVPRSAISHFERLDRSLMPEGLESGLTPEQIAGLLAFLRQPSAIDPQE